MIPEASVPQRLRILIVQSNPILRLGLRQVIEQHGMEVIDETTELEDILHLVALTRPDVVLFDGTLTFRDCYRQYRAAEALDQIRRAGARGIFVLVQQANEENLFQFLIAGAAAYERSTTLTIPELVEKVQCVAAGEYLITDDVLPPVKQQPISPPHHARLPKKSTVQPTLPGKHSQEQIGVTDREVQVLRCAMHGLTNRQTGRALGIASHTTKNHMMHLISKLSVRSRTGAVVYALRKGLISWDDPLPDHQGAVSQMTSHTEKAIAV